MLIAFWGYGDLVGPWYSEPSPHRRHQGSKMTEAEAAKLETGPPISNAGERKGNGRAYYQRCRQLGIWPNKVSTWNPKTDPEKFYPYMVVKNIDKNYPPILMIHGTEDTDMPHEQSVMMAKELKKHGVAHQLISVQNGEHGLGGADKKEIEAAYQQVLPFIKKHTRN